MKTNTHACTHVCTHTYVLIHSLPSETQKCDRTVAIQYISWKRKVRHIPVNRKNEIRNVKAETT